MVYLDYLSAINTEAAEDGPKQDRTSETSEQAQAVTTKRMSVREKAALLDRHSSEST